eukprot:Ihof_evm7s35 gene=Ihof_evmTU7s35
MGSGSSKLTSRSNNRNIFKKASLNVFGPNDWEDSNSAKQNAKDPMLAPYSYSKSSLHVSTDRFKRSPTSNPSSYHGGSKVEALMPYSDANTIALNAPIHISKQVHRHSSKTEVMQSPCNQKKSSHSRDKDKACIRQTKSAGHKSSRSVRDTRTKQAHFRSGSVDEAGSASLTLRRASSLQHISERDPSQELSSQFGIDIKAPFYSGLNEDRAAWETAKNLRKAMKIRYKGDVGLGGISDKIKAKSSSLIRRHAAKECNDLRKHSNSCSTLYVDQTVSRPDLEQIIFCAATAIHTQFNRVLRLQSLPLFDPIFDEMLHPLTSRPVSSSYARKCPPVSDIFDFLRAFFKAAVLKADIAIVSMVYINRLQENGMLLQPANWKRVILGAVMLASKVWDDQAVWNADFRTVLPDVPLDSMNGLERSMLDLLSYNVTVTAGEYAKHYFDLRQCGYRAVTEEGHVMSPLNQRKAVKLDAINLST